MKSDLPKVLVPVAGRPMIDYVLDMLAACGVERVIASSAIAAIWFAKPWRPARA